MREKLYSISALCLEPKCSGSAQSLIQLTLRLHKTLRQLTADRSISAETRTFSTLLHMFPDFTFGEV